MQANANHVSAQMTAFIEQLADSTPNKRRFYHPAWYLLAWLVGSLLYVVALANIVLDVRFDLYMRTSDIMFLVTVGSMFIGAACFAYSSIISSLPGKKDRCSWYGIGMLVTWLACIVYGMVCDIPGLVAGKVFFHFDPKVFSLIFVGGIVPVIGLWCIVSHLAPIQPTKVALTLSLASFMLSATVLRFYYVSLYNGVDCSFNLFFWMLMPLVISSSCGWFCVSRFIHFWLPKSRNR